jgi:hypothetical protein
MHAVVHCMMQVADLRASYTLVLQAVQSNHKPF